MIESVLVPTDDSDPATDALEFAVSEFRDASITALHVIDPSDVYVPSSIEASVVSREEVAKMAREKGESVLESARETAAEHDVDIETELREGDAARSILEYVEGDDVDLVVIGSHGRSGPSRVLLGSVAETVSRRSPVPVTIVR